MKIISEIEENIQRLKEEEVLADMTAGEDILNLENNIFFTYRK